LALRKTLKVFFMLALIGIVSGAGVFLYVQSKAHAPGPHSLDVRVLIAPGASVRTIAAQLQDEGVLRNGLILRLWARYTGQHTRLRAGEFQVPARASIVQVLTLLERGKTMAHKLTLPEGLSVAQVLLLIQDAKGLSGTVTKIPDEGGMLPETYAYAWGDSRDALVTRMTDAMANLMRVQWAAHLDSLPLKTPQEVVILASLVEKETALATERSQVAAVFLNRLRKGMRLQSDPTVVFALTNGSGPLGRALTREDLKVDSPYNTYRVKGLPPAPIANPGRDSILAVMNPADTDALYFVADGSGGHVFARTLKEHNRNVAKWRKLKRR